ncbi:hypothetical protein JCM3774_002477 [Rhodotorula dairenensis]
MRTSTTAGVVAIAVACVTSVHALSYSHGRPQNVRRDHHELARRSGYDQVNVTRRLHRKTRRASNSNSSDDKKTYESTAIWWAEAGWIGSCGDSVSDDAMVLALPLALYPDVLTASPLCGTTVSVSAPSTGKSITATVIGASDRTAYTTFSRAAYQALGGDLDSGELPIEFQLVDGTAPAYSVSVTASDGAALESKSTAADSAAFSTSSTTTSTEAPRTTTTTPPPPPPQKQQTTTERDAARAASESARSKSLAVAAWASASSASAAGAYAFWSSSSSSAAAAAAAASAASKSSADAAWASSSSAAVAAASKSAADAAWASSSSASAAVAAFAASKSAADAAWGSSSSAEAAAAAAKATQRSSPSSEGGHVYSGGKATFFDQHGTAGHCGQVNSDDTLLVALPTETYADGAHCGKYVEITRTATGDKIQALVADSCPMCDNNSCLDLSRGAFSALGGTEKMGTFAITWHFV